ncbi:hypothetical protein FF100_14670 [Methylobacterium terricola]|uniref:Uncharacterized protein n=1 Tax=Methylobacterium terricola TaxID=2583531 RepID=A0A5C4LHR8_9HYPH|nr:hypothetical protein [Methylobacterium terricola]TNC12893.1 hypothetical protein FF100_14670 [Methylobacterium terricola]
MLGPLKPVLESLLARRSGGLALMAASLDIILGLDEAESPGLNTDDGAAPGGSVQAGTRCGF